MTDHIEKEYYSCLKRVELNLPVKFSRLIAKAVEYGQKSLEHFLDQNNENVTKEEPSKDKKKKGKVAVEAGRALTYFVQYVFCTGIIDDLDDSIAQLAQCINLPLTIIIV